MEWLWGSLIGVGATLLGTVVGWFLSKPKNKNIKVILNTPSKLSPQTMFSGSGSDRKGHLTGISLYMDLVFYNPSDSVKLMRNIRTEFFDDKKAFLFSVDIKNLENTTTILPGINLPKEIDAINIGPHVGDLYKCSVALFREDLKKKDLISGVFIVFDDENNKAIKHKIPLPDFKGVKPYQD